MAVEPAQARAVGGIDGQFDGLPAFAQADFDRRDQAIEPFPAQRRYDYWCTIRRLALGQIENTGASIGVEPVDLVPDLNQATVTRLDSEFAQNFFDIVRL